MRSLVPVVFRRLFLGGSGKANEITANGMVLSDITDSSFARHKEHELGGDHSRQSMVPYKSV